MQYKLVPCSGHLPTRPAKFSDHYSTWIIFTASILLPAARVLPPEKDTRGVSFHSPRAEHNSLLYKKNLGEGTGQRPFI